LREQGAKYDGRKKHTEKKKKKKKKKKKANVRDAFWSITKQKQNKKQRSRHATLCLPPLW
jgi:hypothetical protein